MANVYIENFFDWTYDGKNKWYFYTSTGYTQYKYEKELYFSSSWSEISIIGEKFTYKNAADGQYFLTGGTVKGFFVGYLGTHTYISDISISAKQLHSWMLDGSPAASVKIFQAALAGDDEVTLGQGNDRFATFGGDDVVRGRAGNDWIDAGAGDDVLYGGTGKDFLIGGKGEDYFVFDTKPGTSNIDTIDDFSVKDDTIILDTLIYRKVGKPGDLAGSAFHSSATGTAADAADRIIYNSKTGALFYDADGSGKTIAPVQFALLDAGLKLTATDFDLI